MSVTRVCLIGEQVQARAGAFDRHASDATVRALRARWRRRACAPGARHTNKKARRGDACESGVLAPACDRDCIEAATAACRKRDRFPVGAERRPTGRLAEGFQGLGNKSFMLLVTRAALCAIETVYPMAYPWLTAGSIRSRPNTGSAAGSTAAWRTPASACSSRPRAGSATASSGTRSCSRCPSSMARRV